MIVALTAFVAARRSLLSGILTVLTIGYGYGILRANLLDIASHFIFDAAVIGLYLGRLGTLTRRADNRELRQLRLWVGILMCWPVVLFLFPLQNPVIQLVGLRGSIFLLPFLILGALLQREEMYRLSVGLAVLNLLSCAVAVLEYFVGVERFFPRSPVTELVYASKDIANFSSFRIPSVFSGAHAYAGTMVTTIPLLLGAWVQRRRDWRHHLLLAALCGSILGVFLSGTRSHFVVMLLVIVVTTVSGRLNFGSRLIWVAVLLVLGWIVAGQERLQRFEELSDTDFVTSRVKSSVNDSLLEVAGNHPLGIGLGGGGTSVPYFLEHLITNRVLIENEYARILLEQGIPGLVLWVVFIMWAFSRRGTRDKDQWSLGRRLGWFTCAGYFATGLIGIGLLTSIPQTALLLLTLGWIVVPDPIRTNKDVLAGFQFQEQQFQNEKPASTWQLPQPLQDWQTPTCKR